MGEQPARRRIACPLLYHTSSWPRTALYILSHTRRTTSKLKRLQQNLSSLRLPTHRDIPGLLEVWRTPSRSKIPAFHCRKARGVAAHCTTTGDIVETMVQSTIQCRVQEPQGRLSFSNQCIVDERQDRSRAWRSRTSPVDWDAEAGVYLVGS